MNTAHNEQGFTLVEALIAMAILTVGILTLLTMQTTALKGNSKARGITTAANWNQDMIETLLNEEYDAVATGGPVTSPDGFYTTSWTVIDSILPSVPYSTLKQIQVTVARNDFGAQRNIVFNYYRQNNL